MKTLAELFGEAILIATFQQRRAHMHNRVPKEEGFDAGGLNETGWRMGLRGDAASGLCLSSRLLDRS